MPALVCTVRGCGLPLLREERRLHCPRGHAFDRAREGYFNLLQPQDRRSPRPGDRDEAIAARRRWLERGFGEGLAAAVARAAGIDAAPPPAGALARVSGADAVPPRAGAPAAGATVLDVGCGDGWLAARLFADRDFDLCGVDLAVRAVGLAARRLPAATWVVANADRMLPLAVASVDLALSLFGRRPPAELARIVRPGGWLVVAVPAADDLVELREVAKGRGLRRERAEGVVEALAPAFRLEGRETSRERALLDRPAIEDALAMTYRGARRSERVRLAGIDALETTLAAEVLVLARAPAKR